MNLQVVKNDLELKNPLAKLVRSMLVGYCEYIVLFIMLFQNNLKKFVHENTIVTSIPYVAPNFSHPTHSVFTIPVVINPQNLNLPSEQSTPKSSGMNITPNRRLGNRPIILWETAKRYTFEMRKFILKERCLKLIVLYKNKNGGESCRVGNIFLRGGRCNGVKHHIKGKVQYTFTS